MLKGFINKNGLNAEQAEQRLAAIEKLENPDSETQSELQRLTLGDPDDRVRLAAVKKITELDHLVVILDDEKSELSDAAGARITEVLESGSSDNDIQRLLATASNRFNVLVACSSVSDGLRDAALAAISDEQFLADVTCDAKVHQTRMQAAGRLDSPDVQAECLVRIRNRDKQVSRMLQAKVAERNKVIEQTRMHEASVQQLLNAIENLASSAWSPQYAGQFAATEQRWQALDPAPAPEQQANYTQAQEKASAKVKQFQDQQDRLSELSSLLVEAEDTLEVLTSAKLSSLETSSTTAAEILKSLRDRWQQAGATLTIENPFVAEFDHTATTLEKLTPLSVELVAASVHSLVSRKMKGQQSSGVSGPADTAQASSVIPAVTDTGNTDKPDAADTGSSHTDSSATDSPTDKSTAPVEPANDGVNSSEKKSSSDIVTLGEDQRRIIEKALDDDLFTAQMACTPQLRSQLGKLDETLEKARQEQAQLADGIRRQLNALASNISAGKWSAAEGMSKRVERKLEQLQGSQLLPLKQRYDKQRQKLDELADWQDFAALPKLQNLVQSMRDLPAKDLKPRQLADEIKALQDNWKSLGSSRVANQLWDDFKNASDVAYEPCKAYFDGLKKQREARVRNREIVCERIQACLDSTAADPEIVNTREIESLLSQSHKEWRNNRPSGRKPQKQLEERFTELVGKLEALLAPRYEAGIAERQELIEKTRKHAEAETTSQHVINQTKSLQAAWKLCGPAGRKHDQKLWAEFNELCGQIFNRHRQEQREQYKSSMGHVDRARTIIRSLRQLTRQPDDKAEQQFNELQEEFQGLAEFPEKIKKSLVRDFRSAGDSFNRARSSQGRKRKAVEMTALQELARLCEQIERGDIDWIEPPAPASSAETVDNENATTSEENESATDSVVDESTASDSKNESPETAISLDDPFEAWESYAGQIPKPWLKRIAKRRDAAIKSQKASTSPFSEKQDEARRLHCIQLEIMQDLDSPADDRSLRMQYQLEQLQSGPDGTLLGKDAAALKSHEIEWLCMAPASLGIAASLEQRFNQALGSASEDRGKKNKSRKSSGKPA